MEYVQKVLLAFLFLINAAYMVKSASYNDPCDFTNSCNSSQLLICIDGTCKCPNPRHVVFDEEKNSCVAKLNFPCHLEEYFTQNQMQWLSNQYKWISAKSVLYQQELPCPRNTFCNEGTGACNCKSPMIANTKWTKCVMPQNYPPNSKGSYDDFCDDSAISCEAGTGLVCKQGYCKCKFDELQYWSEGKCVSVAGGPCGILDNSTGIYNLTCMNGAECIQTGRHGRCACVNGSLANSQGKCYLLGYGMKCNARKTYGCDKSSFLECVNGICQCPNQLYSYNELERRCRGLVGAPCDITGDNETSIFCVDNANCVSRWRSSKNGLCECQLGYLETETRTCSKI